MTWLRAPVVRIVDRDDTTTIIGKGGVARRFAGGSAALVRAILELCQAPCGRAALLAGLTARAGEPVAEGAVDEAVALLVAEGVLVAPSTPPRPPLARRVVLAVSGAIAAADAPATVRGLQGLGCAVRVALTRAARQFVSARALAALTHAPVPSSLWQGDAASPAPHVELAEWAELVVVAPASATTLARLAHGDASDLVAAIVLATRAPVVVVPSMNAAMYDAPATQANLATLRAHGRWVVHPGAGVEVAHAPDLRRAALGAAPPLAALLEVLRHVLAELPPHAPLGADGWERVWAGAAPSALPWDVAELEPALAAALADAEAGGRRLLDVGTGAGTVAIHAAARGWTVTATDVAPTALVHARRRAPDAAILLALDDATATRVPGPFDVVVDRGVLHGLPPARWPAYAASLRSWLAPGGWLFLVTHAPGTQAGTHPVEPATLAALVPGLHIAATTPTTLSGQPATLITAVLPSRA